MARVSFSISAANPSILELVACHFCLTNVDVLAKHARLKRSFWKRSSFLETACRPGGAEQGRASGCGALRGNSRVVRFTPGKGQGIDCQSPHRRSSGPESRCDIKNAAKTRGHGPKRGGKAQQVDRTCKFRATVAASGDRAHEPG